MYLFALSTLCITLNAHEVNKNSNRNFFIFVYLSSLFLLLLFFYCPGVYGRKSILNLLLLLLPFNCSQRTTASIPPWIRPHAYVSGSGPWRWPKAERSHLLFNRGPKILCSPSFLPPLLSNLNIIRPALLCPGHKEMFCRFSRGSSTIQSVIWWGRRPR